QVRDRSVESEVKTAEKADPNNRGHVGSPFAGVVTMQVQEGDQVDSGDTIATIEAMKMEATITTQTAGTVSRVAIAGVQQLRAGAPGAVVVAWAAGPPSGRRRAARGRRAGDSVRRQRAGPARRPGPQCPAGGACRRGRPADRRGTARLLL